jgi:hypothetical protein
VGNFYDSDTAFPVGPGSALPYIDFCSVYPFLSQSWKQCEIGGLPPGQLNGVEGTVDGVAYNLTLMTVSLRLAGTPSSPDVDALQHPGDPVITLPIKFQINGPGLGNTCSVGTESDPIMLHLKTITPPTDTTTDTDPNGYPVSFTTYWDGKIADSSFAEPGATGCGPGDLLDGVVNGLLGLPSAAGQNSFTMDHLVTAIASTTAGGEVLSQSFHAWQGF